MEHRHLRAFEMNMGVDETWVNIEPRAVDHVRCFVSMPDADDSIAADGDIDAVFDFTAQNVDEFAVLEQEICAFAS